MNRIHLGAIVEREGRILLIRQTPRSAWELPGGALQARQDDADQAMAESLETFGILITEPEERFIETIYLPDDQGQVIYNIYGAGDWQGEPEIPIGMGAGWFTFDELASITMQDEIRQAVLVAYGMAEAVDPAAKILAAMSGAVSDAEAHQPALGASRSPFARPGATDVTLPDGRVTDTVTDASDAGPEPIEGLVDPSDVPDTGEEVADEGEEIVEELREEPIAEEPAEEYNELVELAGMFDRGPETPEAEAPASVVAPEPDEPDVAAAAVPAFDPSPRPPTRRQLGLDVLSTLGGGSDPVAGFDRLIAQYPELGADVVDFAMGEVWASDGLTRRERSLLVVAMLSAMGGRPGPLASHLNGALNHGATPDELVETLRMVAVYAGFPAALEAWKLMEATFEAKGVKPSGRKP